MFDGLRNKFNAIQDFFEWIMEFVSDYKEGGLVSAFAENFDLDAPGPDAAPEPDLS